MEGYHQNTGNPPPPNFDLRTGSFINNDNLSSLSNTMEMEVNRPLNLSDDCDPGRIQPNRLARRSLDQMEDSLGSLPLPDFDLNDENVIMNAFTDFLNATDNNEINMTQEALEIDVSLEETSQLGIHEVRDERTMLSAITPADDSMEFSLPSYLPPPPPPDLLQQPTPSTSAAAAAAMQQQPPVKNNPKKARKRLPKKNANSKKKEKEKKGEKQKRKKKGKSKTEDDHDFEIDNVKKFKARLSVSRTCEENETNPVRTIGETNPIDHPEKFIKNLAFVIDNVAFGNENGAGAELNGVDIKQEPLDSDNNSQQSSSSKNLLPVSTSTHSQQGISNQQLQDIIANNVNDIQLANKPNAIRTKTQIETEIKIRVSVKQRRRTVIDNSNNSTNNNAIENAVQPTSATTPKPKRKYVRKTPRLSSNSNSNSLNESLIQPDNINPPDNAISPAEPINTENQETQIQQNVPKDNSNLDVPPEFNVDFLKDCKENKNENDTKPKKRTPRKIKPLKEKKEKISKNKIRKGKEKTKRKEPKTLTTNKVIKRKVIIDKNSKNKVINFKWQYTEKEKAKLYEEGSFVVGKMEAQKNYMLKDALNLQIWKIKESRLELFTGKRHSGKYILHIPANRFISYSRDKDFYSNWYPVYVESCEEVSESGEVKFPEVVHYYHIDRIIPVMGLLDSSASYFPEYCITFQLILSDIIEKGTMKRAIENNDIYFRHPWDCIQEAITLHRHALKESYWKDFLVEALDKFPFINFTRTHIPKDLVCSVCPTKAIAIAKIVLRGNAYEPLCFADSEEQKELDDLWSCFGCQTRIKSYSRITHHLYHLFTALYLNIKKIFGRLKNGEKITDKELLDYYMLDEIYLKRLFLDFQVLYAECLKASVKTIQGNKQIGTIKKTTNAAIKN